MSAAIRHTTKEDDSGTIANDFGQPWTESSMVGSQSVLALAALGRVPARASQVPRLETAVAALRDQPRSAPGDCAALQLLLPEAASRSHHPDRQQRRLARLGLERLLAAALESPVAGCQFRQTRSPGWSRSDQSQDPLSIWNPVARLAAQGYRWALPLPLF